MNRARGMLTIGAAVLVASLTSCSDDGDVRSGTVGATSSPAGVSGWLPLNAAEDGTMELALR